MVGRPILPFFLVGGVSLGNQNRGTSFSFSPGKYSGQTAPWVGMVDGWTRGVPFWGDVFDSFPSNRLIVGKLSGPKVILVDLLPSFGKTC